MIDSSYFNLSSNNIIKYPIITDKATRLLENNQYSFIVNSSSDKLTIKATIEYLFNVKVTKVTTSHLPRKKKRIGKYVGWKSQYKKAIVTLADGDTINLFAEN
uniref:Large ribosomal subunit protein uL23c n=1 Tax=Chaetoceros muelleri TaxID=265525 RepID=A0A7L9K465_9STRA|nr:ribosomal protein L23 [Chaetoceros muellerii]QOK36077.1 ribosomal protein L23 [Chaetoceros muellerii]